MEKKGSIGMIDLLLSVLTLSTGLVASFGWFFALGHLLISKFSPEKNSVTIIFGISCAASAALLTTITPWIALPPPILLIVGLLITAGWVLKKISLPKLQISSMKSLTLFFTIFFLTIYGFNYILIPDTNFDSVSYHLPFINEFAKYGQIPFPKNPINWTDHVHFVFPKAVETIYGLADQLIPEFHSFIHFLILISVVSILNRLAVRFGVKDNWATGALFLGSTSAAFLFVFNMLQITSGFFVELTIFMFFLILLVFLLEEKNQSNNIILLFILGMAISLSKINAIIYLVAAGSVVWLFTKEWKYSVAAIAGGVAGFFAHLVPVLLSQYSFFEELKLVQAISDGTSTTISRRAEILLKSVQRFMSVGTIGFGFMLAIPMMWIRKEARVLLAILIVSFFFFFVSFLASDLYSLTYFQFAAYYMYGFVGISIIPLVLFIERLSLFLHEHAETAKILLFFPFLVLGVVSTLGSIYFYQQHYLYSGEYYYDILNNIPNDETTKLFFMNNINPVTLNLDKATIVDHTTFSSVSGDPCVFWRKNEITHIVFWALSDNYYQLGKGNSKFYEDAKKELFEENCTVLLIPESEEELNQKPVIIAKVKE